mmetsp:Transcript_9383/g.57241  ORF Transcript_9383/g.57241 Transcript_9383/m.57241 type:complete len:913 (-) Transcript_9383:397-3135(-)
MERSTMHVANVAPTSARASKRTAKHVEGDVTPPLAATTVGNGAGPLVGVAVVAAAAGAAVHRAFFTPKPPKDRMPFALPVGEPLEGDTDSFAANLGYHAKFSAATEPLVFGPKQAYKTVAASVQERLVERWDETYALFEEKDPKMAYYISMEYLQGRALTNAIQNIGRNSEYEQALTQFGYDLEDLEEMELDAGLGNGGLGRLAACFLDSIASCDLPAWGYGLRYKYGLFKQVIKKDGQHEVAEDWLDEGRSPWEVRRDELKYDVGFGGKVVGGKWEPENVVCTTAYDMPIPGYKTRNTISLRLWSVDPPSSEFDLSQFNAGEHLKAQEAQILGLEICAVLYPGDDTLEGKKLRLRQQYLLCSASIQDLMATFKRRQLMHKGRVNWDEFASKVAVQMNDTHPTLAVPELIRILVDEEGLTFEKAWTISCKTLNYTNHTVLPEALEKWPLKLLDELLPRHMEIVRRIDSDFIASMKPLAGESQEDFEGRLAKMTILENFYKQPGDDSEDSPAPLVRMANLCVIAGQYVNGVAALHTEIVKADVFNHFYKVWPDKFQNKTNGVTPRRWLAWCNPELSAVITKWLGTDSWVTDLTKLKGLAQYAKDPELQKEWKAAKVARKEKFAVWVKEETGIDIPIDSMYDVQIKRIHEYKRQLLNILSTVYRYKKIKEMTPQERKEVVPRVIMFGGKAFATYVQAKRIVKLIVAASEIINADKEVGDLLKVVFLPNYRVTVAEMTIPATELCQQISTAGMEASGTSNMKFMMNGSLTIGTLDGANVEIRQEAGAEHFFLFGAVTEDVPKIRADRAAGKFVPDPRFEEVKDYIKSGVFGESFEELLSSLEGNEGFGRGDYFIVGHDFPSYLEAQQAVDEAYKDESRWLESSVLNTAASGKFSSDRTIRQYASEIWDIEPCRVP